MEDDCHLYPTCGCGGNCYCSSDDGPAEYFCRHCENLCDRVYGPLNHCFDCAVEIAEYEEGLEDN